MGNRFGNAKAGPDVSMKLSNGGTSVLLATLLLAASDHARSTWERELATWLAERDQSVIGLGVVGFDVDEIGWGHDDFEARKAFLLRVVDAAAAGHRWETLPYEPALEPHFYREFAAVVAAYEEAFVDAGTTWRWLFERPDPLRTCPVHEVYVHVHGCQICNDR